MLQHACQNAMDRATDSISLLVNAEVRGKIQGISLMTLSGFFKRIREIQDQAVGIVAKVKDGLNGLILIIIIDYDLVDHLLDFVLMNYGDYMHEEDLSIDLEVDMLKEIAEIIIGNLIQELSKLFKTSVRYESPSVAIDIVTAIPKQLHKSLLSGDTNVLILHTVLELDGHEHTADIVLMLSSKVPKG